MTDTKSKDLRCREPSPGPNKKRPRSSRCTEEGHEIKWQNNDNKPRASKRARQQPIRKGKDGTSNHKYGSSTEEGNMQAATAIMADCTTTKFPLPLPSNTTNNGRPPKPPMRLLASTITNTNSSQSNSCGGQRSMSSSSSKSSSGQHKKFLHFGAYRHCGSSSSSSTNPSGRSSSSLGSNQPTQGSSSDQDTLSTQSNSTGSANNKTSLKTTTPDVAMSALVSDWSLLQIKFHFGKPVSHTIGLTTQCTMMRMLQAKKQHQAEY